MCCRVVVLWCCCGVVVVLLMVLLWCCGYCGCFGDMLTKMGCAWPQTHHDAMQQSLRLIGGSHLEVKLPATPPPPPALDNSRLIPDVSGHPAKTASVENLQFSAQSAHPDCWDLSLHARSNEQRNRFIASGATTEMSTTTSKTATVAPPRFSTLSPIPGTCRCTATA